MRKERAHLHFFSDVSLPSCKLPNDYSTSQNLSKRWRIFLGMNYYVLQSSLKRWRKIRPHLFTPCFNTTLGISHRSSAEDGKRMYQKVWFTCRVVGCLPFTKSSRKIQSESKWNTILLFASGSNGTSEKEVLGAFHSTKTSGLNFRQLQVANGAAFYKISQKKTTSRGIPKFGKFFSWKFCFHSTLLLEFLETFPGNFCTIYRCFQVFERFNWLESA